jgi:uncharacterized protein
MAGFTNITTRSLEIVSVHIPARHKCQELLDGMQMPAHIQAHSRIVCEVALLLSDRLQKAGVPLNHELIRASALLHDITKPRSFETGENHAQTGGQYLSNLGFREVGEIVRQHVVLDNYSGDAAPSEAEVVNYADKRVLHDQIVPLNERMAYILHRYARTSERRQLLIHFWEKAELLEKRIFGYLSFEPDGLGEQLESIGGNGEEG